MTYEGIVFAYVPTHEHSLHTALEGGSSVTMYIYVHCLPPPTGYAEVGETQGVTEGQ